MKKGTISHEYLVPDGLPSFVTGARKFLLGANSEALASNRVASSQTISGTGALNLAFNFLSKFLPRFVYVSNPTWQNHKSIIESFNMKWIEYPYYDGKTKGLNFEGMINCLENSISRSIVLLHSCAHNPTGVDPTEEQWKKIAQVMKAKKLIPFFDSAYQGFASGCL